MLLKRYVYFIALLLSAFAQAQSQVVGCTDPAANNYTAAATVNNGSCTYNSQSYTPPLRANLNTTTVKEISGMIYFNGKLLALNDSGGGNLLFVLDSTTGDVLQTITVDGALNNDWEDLAQDSTYVYVGDFGNNTSGNRTDLAIYRIERQAFMQTGNFTIPSSAVSKINFTYPDQTDFTATANNSTRFDCEALIVRRGKIHLFSKNWLGNYTTHYALPVVPGAYMATRLDSMDTNGIMITGASLGADDELLLTGYSKTGACSLFLLYGFDESDSIFASGNKRQIQLPSALTTGQIESVCFVDATHGFVANEYQVFAGIFTVTNKLRTFNSLSWILPYYQHNQKNFAMPGMIRFNVTTNKYEVFNGNIWENFKGQ